MVRHNNVVPNVHFHKDWARRVKTWFNQPARRRRRAVKRVQKASYYFPRPTSGHLRPVVRCPGRRHNSRLRLGRGFTLKEVKDANWDVKTARSYGVAVDFRRRNSSLEGLNINVARLKLYKSKLVPLPKHWGLKNKKPSQKTKNAIASQTAKRRISPSKSIVQQTSTLPLPPSSPLPSPRVIKEHEKKFNAYKFLRHIRYLNKYGRRSILIEKQKKKKKEQKEAEPTA